MSSSGTRHVLQYDGNTGASLGDRCCNHPKRNRPWPWLDPDHAARRSLGVQSGSVVRFDLPDLSTNGTPSAMSSNQVLSTTTPSIERRLRRMVGSVQPRASSAVAPEKPSRLQENLMEMERGRERYWRGHPGTSALKLCWRAATVRHSFQHLLPGESILETRRGQRALDRAPFDRLTRARTRLQQRFLIMNSLHNIATYRTQGSYGSMTFSKTCRRKALITSSAPQFFATTSTRKIWRPSGDC